MATQESKPKKKYLIKVEGLAPVMATFEVWAEDEEQAAQIFEKQPNLVKLRERPFIDLPHMHKRKVSVQDLLTGMMKVIRSF
jgi:hypothetical protein